MSEEQQEIKPGQSEATSDSGEDMVSRAEKAAERLEEANKKHEDLLQKQQAENVRRTLGGKSEVGGPPAEETPEQYKDRIMKGE